MCVTSHVRRDSGKRYSEADGLRIHEPEADEPAPRVRPGEVGHTSRCHGAEYIGCGGGEEASCVVVSDAHRGLRMHELTIGHVEDDGSTDQQRNNLHRVTNRFELRGHRRAESHVANDDRRERVDNTVGDSAVRHVLACETSEVSGLQTHAAKTLMKMRIVFGSVKPNLIWLLSKDLFLIPMSLLATRLTATRRSRWLRKYAFDGESGRTNHTAKAQMHVAPPS
jgi:hypothetical protein